MFLHSRLFASLQQIALAKLLGESLKTSCSFCAGVWGLGYGTVQGKASKPVCCEVSVIPQSPLTLTASMWNIQPYVVGGISLD